MFSRQPMFRLKGITYGQRNTIQKKESAQCREHYLHPLLMTYIYRGQHFKTHTKTIYHENSTKTEKNFEKWIHLDLTPSQYGPGHLSKERFNDVKLKAMLRHKHKFEPVRTCVKMLYDIFGSMRLQFFEYYPDTFSIKVFLIHNY